MEICRVLGKSLYIKWCHLRFFRISSSICFYNKTIINEKKATFHVSMKIWKFHFFARFAYLLQDILTYCYVLLLTSMGFCDDYEKNKIMLQDLILKRNQLPINYLSTIKAMKFNSNEIFLTVRNTAGLSGSTGVNGFSSFTSQNHRYMSFCGLLCSEGVF